MAAEVLAAAGLPVTVFERKPNPGRKFLLAGRGGLNLTHSEDLQSFIARYGVAAERLRPAIEKFPPTALRTWCEGLGEPTFIGTSGRIFPKNFKASPLLRAWRVRLESLGVKFEFQKKWIGWNEAGALLFTNAEEKTETVTAAATVLALGGASWPRLGADGNWVDILQQQHIAVAPLRPANCGFVVDWSDVFRSKFTGQPIKPVTLSFKDKTIQGEMMVTEKGIEGGAVYALSAALREGIFKEGKAELKLDLRPGVTAEELTRRLSAPRGTLSFSNFLRKAGGLSPIAAALVREVGGKDVQTLPASALAGLIKTLPLHLTASFSLDRAISTAGGIALEAMDDNFMLKSKPGVFAVGEMLDWEAPTGGYLLQATFSMAVCAADGLLRYIKGKYPT